MVNGISGYGNVPYSSDPGQGASIYDIFKQEVSLFLLEPTDGNLLEQIEKRFGPLAKQLPKPLADAIKTILGACHSIYAYSELNQELEEKIKQDPSSKSYYEAAIQKNNGCINQDREIIAAEYKNLPMG